MNRVGEQLDTIEAWFIRRGVPHFVERYDSAWGTWGRAIPFLVVGYLLLGLNALNLSDWSWRRNLLAAALVVTVLLVIWVVANLLRRLPPLHYPTSVGPVELAVLVLAPAVPSLLLGQWGSLLRTILQGVGGLVLIWWVASYGIVYIIDWATERTLAQLDVFANTVVRALPLLLLFVMFLFINAEVWLIAGTLTGPLYAIVVGVFFVLGLVFLVTRVPPLLRKLNTFSSWEEIVDLANHEEAAVAASAKVAADSPADLDTSRLLFRQRFNAGLVALFPQMMQITFAAVAIFVFFGVFGVLAIPGDVVARWTQLADVNTLATFSFGGRDLVLTEPLLRVSLFLAMFTGMYFTVVLSTDATYREEFTADIGPELRRALAVRQVYRALLSADDAQEDDTNWNVTKGNDTMGDESIAGAAAPSGNNGGGGADRHEAEHT